MLTVLFALAMVQQPKSASPAGTYAVTFCSSECAESDTSLVMAQGVVVLDTVRLPNPTGKGEDLAACLHIERRKSVYGYLALVSPARSRWWKAPADSIGFFTYQTPEAFHIVNAQLGKEGFRGTGTSDGEGIAEIDVADEYVIGRRVGPPDPKQCRLTKDKPPGR